MLTKNYKTLSTDTHLSCPLLNVFNYKYETWNEEADYTANLHAGDVLIKVSEHSAYF